MAVKLVRTSSQYITTSGIEFNGAFTIGMWFRALTVVQAQYPWHFDCRDNGLEVDIRFWAAGGANNGQVIFYIDDGPNKPTIIGATEYDDGNWHYLMCVRDTTADKIRMRVENDDQELADSTTGSLPTTTDTISIGAESGGGYYYDGGLSEVCVWEAALTLDEFKLIRDSKKRMSALQIRSANLKLYLPLDDFGASGATMTGANSLKDLSYNGNHGTPQNNPVSEPCIVSYKNKPIFV